MQYDILVIGGGIVGLATALKLKTRQPQLKLGIVEKEETLAAHQTGHNSGVIHSGVYYKPGSLKALNCINGYKQLIKFCRNNDIKYELCGKVIVATSQEELEQLEKIYSRGIENGLKGLIRLNKEELLNYEPYVQGIEGIYVPQTGIIDFKEVAQKYASLIREKDGTIHLGEKVLDIRQESGKSTVVTGKTTYQATTVVNCAGLYSDKIASITHPELNIRIIPFRGEYYELKKEKHHLVKNLIYPVPDPNFPFLGVHFTRMIHGGVEAGPNAVLAFKREGYRFLDFNLKEFAETLNWPGFRKVAAKYWRTGIGEMYRSLSKAAFTKALQKLIPSIREEDLKSGGAGVRAQACEKNGKLVDDFLILENENIVNVCNAPSPAATSSLAIGDTVSEMVLKRYKDKGNNISTFNVES